MSVLKPEGRNLLFNRQNGISPLSGLPLDREKQHLEVHHIEEVCKGGRNNLDNLQLLPIDEHLATHFLRSRDSGLSEEERLRELDIVLGRMGEMNSEEKKKFYGFIKEKVGIVVRFI